MITTDMERNDIDRLVRRNIATLSPYSTARDEYQGELGTFLDANENPYENGYNCYPDPHQRAEDAPVGHQGRACREYFRRQRQRRGLSTSYSASSANRTRTMWWL